MCEQRGGYREKKEEREEQEEEEEKEEGRKGCSPDSASRGTD